MQRPSGNTHRSHQIVTHDAQWIYSEENARQTVPGSLRHQQCYYDRRSPKQPLVIASGNVVNHSPHRSSAVRSQFPAGVTSRSDHSNCAATRLDPINQRISDAESSCRSPRESGYYSGDSVDGAQRAKRDVQHNFTDWSDKRQTTYPTARIISQKTSEALLTHAESDMDRFVQEEESGNLHEALMHINKAVYIYHQLLTTNEPATPICAEDRIRLRVKYNTAMLKLRRLVQLMTSSCSTSGESASSCGPQGQLNVVRSAPGPAGHNGRRQTRAENNLAVASNGGAQGDRSRDARMQDSRVTFVSRPTEEYRICQTYATLPKRDSLPRVNNKAQCSLRTTDAAADKRHQIATDMPVYRQSKDHKRSSSLPRQRQIDEHLTISNNTILPRQDTGKVTRRAA